MSEKWKVGIRNTPILPQTNWGYCKESSFTEISLDSDDMKLQPSKILHEYCPSFSNPSISVGYLLHSNM